MTSSLHSPFKIIGYPLTPALIILWSDTQNLRYFSNNNKETNVELSKNSLNG
jgi:hypothetical protein